MIVEHALVLEIDQIRAYGIEAVVQIVAAVEGGVHAIIGDGTQGAAHGGALFVGVGDGFRLAQAIRVCKQIVHLPHDDIRTRERHGQNDVHAQNQDNAFQPFGNDLTDGHLNPPRRVEHFAYNGKNRKPKAEHNADQRHAPINIIDCRVVQKDVEEENSLSIIAHLGQAGEDFKELRQPVDGPADDFEYGKE